MTFEVDEQGNVNDGLRVHWERGRGSRWLGDSGFSRDCGG